MLDINCIDAVIYRNFVACHINPQEFLQQHHYDFGEYSDYSSWQQNHLAPA